MLAKNVKLSWHNEKQHSLNIGLLLGIIGFFNMLMSFVFGYVLFMFDICLRKFLWTSDHGIHVNS